MLNFTEDSLNLLCQKIGTNGTPKIDLETGVTMPRFAKKTRPHPNSRKMTIPDNSRLKHRFL